MHFDLQEHTFWANNLLKRGKRRLISDIRRSIGDGQTLVYVLETLGKNGASLFDIDIIQYLVACNVYDCFTRTNKQSEYRPSSIVDVCGPCFRSGNEASHEIIFPVFPYQESFLYTFFCLCRRRLIYVVFGQIWKKVALKSDWGDYGLMKSLKPWRYYLLIRSRLHIT